MNTCGKINHVVVDMYFDESFIFSKLSKPTYNEFDQHVVECISKSEAKLLKTTVHHFNDEGAFTSLYLLSESHISFHTWPENNYIAMDVFTCGNCDSIQLAKDIMDYLKPSITTSHYLKRGLQ
jgi:S-adenosylmethionine decarboxylase proenzyme